MQRPLNIFEAEAKAHEFDRIISLGCNCELALNIRAYFGIERAYPFDWWITPFQALWKLLEDRFHDLFNINHLEVSSDLLTVRDKHYNLLYHHDFQKTEDEIVIPDIIEQQIPLLKQKYDMLIHRFFKDLQNKRVLFIRNRDGNIPHLDRDTTPMNENTFGQLYDLLEKMFPESAISLLITNCPVHASIQRKNGCIVWDEVDYHHDDYQFFIGSRRGWQDMFSRNNIFYAGACVSNPLK